MVYVPGVDVPRSITPVVVLIVSPAGSALNVPPVAPVVVSVVVAVAQKVPPLTVAVGDALTVTLFVAVPLHGAVPKLYVIVYVPGVDAPRSITPVVVLIVSPAGEEENVPPVAPVVVSVVVAVAQKVPPLTVAVGDALTVTVLVAIPLNCVVPKL